MKVPRALGIAQYLFFAAAANAKGQGGMEFWIMQSLVPNPQDVLILHAQSRLLIVRIPTIVGVLQVVVAHSLDSSYRIHRVLEWWAECRTLLRKLLVPNISTIWLIDANTTVGTVQSEEIGPHHLETKTHL